MDEMSFMWAEDKKQNAQGYSNEALSSFLSEVQTGVVD